MASVNRTVRRGAMLYARIALGVGFLSAVADRFGIWGRPGARNVAWGDFPHFVHYAGILNPFVPARLIPALGWVVTACEIVCGVALIAGIALRPAALFSGLLLLGFATGMTIGTGVKTAFDASVFAASAGALLLGLEADSAEPTMRPYGRSATQQSGRTS